MFLECDEWTSIYSIWIVGNFSVMLQSWDEEKLTNEMHIIRIAGAHNQTDFGSYKNKNSSFIKWRYDFSDREGEG